jgi:hypothetical protein
MGFLPDRQVHRESKGRIAGIHLRCEEASRTATSPTRRSPPLQTFKDGAIAVKSGRRSARRLGQRRPLPAAGRQVLMPVYGLIQKQDRTLFAHVAEPSGAWGPRTHQVTGRQNPRAHQTVGPTKEAMLESETGSCPLSEAACSWTHLGSNEEDFKALAKRLDVS